MIYFVEDDDNIRELVIYTLCNTGMDAKGFALPSAFFECDARTLAGLDSFGFDVAGGGRIRNPQESTA